jgi:hypothetical protein
MRVYSPGAAGCGGAADGGAGTIGPTVDDSIEVPPKILVNSPDGGVYAFGVAGIEALSLFP